MNQEETAQFLEMYKEAKKELREKLRKLGVPGVDKMSLLGMRLIERRMEECKLGGSESSSIS